MVACVKKKKIIIRLLQMTQITIYANLFANLTSPNLQYVFVCLPTVSYEPTSSKLYHKFEM